MPWPEFCLLHLSVLAVSAAGTTLLRLLVQACRRLGRTRGQRTRVPASKMTPVLNRATTPRVPLGPARKKIAMDWSYGPR